MNAEEMQRKIEDYERRMVRYQRMIGRLQDDLFGRDNEIRSAKFTLLQALPELNPPVLNAPDLLRVPGRLDFEIFKKACLEVCLTDPSNHDNEVMKNERATNMAEILHGEWSAKINGDWMLHITGADQEGGDELDLIQIEMPDILDVKEKYGDELYSSIKTAWYEVQEGRRTGVEMKPWNYLAGRELTLTELLGPLLVTIQNLRNNH